MRCCSRFFAALAAGTVLNLAIAWSSCLLSNTLDRELSLASLIDGPWTTLLIRRHQLIPVAYTGGSNAVLQRMDVAARTPDAAHSPSCVAQYCSAGWPIHAFEGYRIAQIAPRASPLEPHRATSVAHYGALPFEPDPPTPFSVVLPLRPLWRGLVTNSLIYAFPCFLTLWGLSLARARRRARRAACTNCGHSLHGSSRCPECGTPLSAARQGPTGVA
jgi:hypothetical protein